MNDVEAIWTGSLLYNADIGVYPGEMVALVNDPRSEDAWDGPYLDKMPDENAFHRNYSIEGRNFYRRLLLIVKNSIFKRYRYFYRLE